MKPILLTAALMMLCAQVYAGVLYRQPPDPNGGFYHSSWWDPDGSNYDEYVWDRFILASDADVDSIDWRGTYDPAYGGDTPVVDFTVGIYGSIPGGSEPDVAHPPLVEYQVGGNASETYAGVFGGSTMYDYHFKLPAPFHAQAGIPYWVQIEGWQWGFPGWSIARGTSGDGFHFRCQHNNLLADVPTGCYFTRPSGDAAFSLLTATIADVSDPRGSHDFVLRGALPNPSRCDRLSVSFSLPNGAPAELAIFDVGGRCLVSAEVGALGEGSHVIDLAAPTLMDPGVYFARLLQGSRSQLVKVIVTR